MKGVQNIFLKNEWTFEICPIFCSIDNSIKFFFFIQDGASTVGEERILVIGATNRPKDLDEAARRRLSKRLYVPLPESSARVKIIENMLESQSHHLESDELEKIGEMTDGYSGADMSCLCRYFRFKIQSNLVIRNVLIRN